MLVKVLPWLCGKYLGKPFEAGIPVRREGWVSSKTLPYLSKERGEREGGEREREKDKDRQTDRQTEWERDRVRETERQKERK